MTNKQKQERKIKDFGKLYTGKVIRLNEDLMPVVRNMAGAGEERILKFPDCRSALAIMIMEYGALYLHEGGSLDELFKTYRD